MKVFIKNLDPVEMEVKNKGMEITIRSPDGKKQLGDLIVSKTGLEWCKGKTSSGNGKKMKWEEFIKIAESG